MTGTTGIRTALEESGLADEVDAAAVMALVVAVTRGFEIAHERGLINIRTEFQVDVEAIAVGMLRSFCESVRTQE